MIETIEIGVERAKAGPKGTAPKMALIVPSALTKKSYGGHTLICYWKDLHLKVWKIAWTCKGIDHLHHVDTSKNREELL